MRVWNGIKNRLKRTGLWFWRYKYIIGVVFTVLMIWYINCLPETYFNEPTCTVIRDGSGRVLNARIAEDGQWRFPYNPNVPEKFQKAILQFEDREFYHHHGVRLSSLARATWQNLSAGRVVSGGSTITMQMIRMMRGNQSRTFYEKFVEIIWASRIEWSRSKDDILALYASNAPMGGNVVGLDAAAWRYFGRNPDELSWAEAATLAVLPNAPGLLHPGKNRDALKNKRNRLLDQLKKVGEIDELTWELAVSEPLFPPPQDLPHLAPHLTDRFLNQGRAGENITTTLDGQLQEEVNYVLKHHYQRLRGDKIHNAAVLVIDVRENKVISYNGNIPGIESEHGKFVDAIPAPRSSGSILKPFLYAFMLEDGKILPDMLVEDVPTIFSGYHPTNYYDKYDGAVPASNALARSLNVPAVRMLNSYGTRKFLKKMQQLGFSTLTRPASEYGLSLVLGGAEVSLEDLAYAYTQMARTLNNSGNVPDDIKARPQFADGKKRAARSTKIINDVAIWNTFKAMVEVGRPEIDANWNLFQSGRKVAWKTGTSFGFRDAWAVGVTPDYVVAVWAGNVDGEGRPGLVGVKAAAPILFDVFGKLPSTGWFSPPLNKMKEVSICVKSGHKADEYCPEVKTEWVPDVADKTIPCPYHINVLLDETEQYRVNRSCYAQEPIEKKWFVLPPMIAQYYKKQHPDYQPLPPLHPDCAHLSDEKVMSFVYPTPQSSVFVPTDVDGKRSKVVLEVAHTKSDVVLYWFLDEQYLGQTTSFHQMEADPQNGSHVLTVVDQYGNQIKCEFSVHSKGGNNKP